MKKKKEKEKKRCSRHRNRSHRQENSKDQDVFGRHQENRHSFIIRFPGSEEARVDWRRGCTSDQDTGLNYPARKGIPASLRVKNRKVSFSSIPHTPQYEGGRPCRGQNREGQGWGDDSVNRVLVVNPQNPCGGRGGSPKLLSDSCMDICVHQK